MATSKARPATPCRRCAAIRSPTRCSAPGNADLTAHVDFEALAHAAETIGARVHGPVDPGRVPAPARHRDPRRRAQEGGAADKAAEIDTALARLTDAGRARHGQCSRRSAFADPKLAEPAGLRNRFDASRRLMAQPITDVGSRSARSRADRRCQCASRRAAAASATPSSPAEGGVSGGVYASLNGGIGSHDAAGARRREPRPHGGGARRRAGSTFSPPIRSTRRRRRRRDAVAGDARPRADAIVTRVAGLAVGVSTADCGPVLFADARRGVIGAAHAGWRGALAGVIDATIAAMERLGAERAPHRRRARPDDPPAELRGRAGLDRRSSSPPIAANDRFFRPSPKAGHAMFDLAGYIAARLIGAPASRRSRISACAPMPIPSASSAIGARPTAARRITAATSMRLP